MIKKPLATTLLIACAAAVSACGSSKAPGVQPAPGAGLTQAAITSTTPTQTTTTPTATTPKPPSPLSKKPAVNIPKGPAPTHLVSIDLIKGTGTAAKSSSTVTVNYVGVLYKNGKEFDSSWKRGQPSSFPLTGVIAGWTQGIPGMRVGGRRELIIPPSLGYKNQSQPGIPANSTLVFVIDLLAVS